MLLWGSVKIIQPQPTHFGIQSKYHIYRAHDIDSQLKLYGILCTVFQGTNSNDSFRAAIHTHTDTETEIYFNNNQIKYNRMAKSIITTKLYWIVDAIE